MPYIPLSQFAKHHQRGPVNQNNLSGIISRDTPNVINMSGECQQNRTEEMFGERRVLRPISGVNCRTAVAPLAAATATPCQFIPTFIDRKIVVKGPNGA